MSGMANTRIERDSLGDVAVPADRLWGAQTQRSIDNFPIGVGPLSLRAAGDPRARTRQAGRCAARTRSWANCLPSARS